METLKEGVGVHSLVHGISKVKEARQRSRMGIRTSDKWINYSYELA
jgi:hypothetical protein